MYVASDVFECCLAWLVWWFVCCWQVGVGLVVGCCRMLCLQFAGFGFMVGLCGVGWWFVG